MLRQTLTSLKAGLRLPSVLHTPAVPSPLQHLHQPPLRASQRPSSSSAPLSSGWRRYAPLYLYAPSVSATEAAAAAIATVANQPGDAVLLYGDLAAGKTVFARAFLRTSTGMPSLPVSSPTFTIATAYQHGGRSLHHIDLYRLKDTREAAVLALPDVFAHDTSLVEWPDRLTDADRRRRRRRPPATAEGAAATEGNEGDAEAHYKLHGPPHADAVPWSYMRSSEASPSSSSSASTGPVSCPAYPLFPSSRLTVLLEDAAPHAWEAAVTGARALAPALAADAPSGGATSALLSGPLPPATVAAPAEADHASLAEDESIDWDEQGAAAAAAASSSATAAAAAASDGARVLSLWLEGEAWALRRPALVSALERLGWGRVPLD